MKHKQLILTLLSVAKVVSLLTACGPSAQELTQMTAAAFTDTPAPTATPAPIATHLPDPERGQLFYELGPEGVHEPFCANCHKLTNLDLLGTWFRENC